MDSRMCDEDKDYAYVDQFLDLIGITCCRISRATEVCFEEGSLSCGESFKLIHTYFGIENVLNTHEAEQKSEKGLFVDSIDLILSSPARFCLDTAYFDRIVQVCFELALLDIFHAYILEDVNEHFSGL